MRVLDKKQNNKLLIQFRYKNHGVNLRFRIRSEKSDKIDLPLITQNLTQ